MAKILIIDDEAPIRKVLKEILEYESHTVEIAENGMVGLEKLESNDFEVVLCDIKMPKMDGLEVLDKILEKDTDVQVIMISGHGNVETAVEAMKKGAYDFIEKPVDLNRLLSIVRNALDKKTLVSETKKLRKKINKTFDMIGDSAAIVKIKNIIDRVANTDARVMITGSNGTGKELVARWLHEKSDRSVNQFVEVNCAAIPSELIESELFGHEKGAFTSAHKQRKGKFELAHEGTIFLDEIGDMSLAAQAKVLRVLQENKIARVGGDKDIKVNVRVVAATNKDLKEEIKHNRFREDLYHRLSVILIHVPSLNERVEDIPLLADHFIEMVCEEYNMPKKKITKDAIEELQKLQWTGNIREFRNVIERLIILCEKEITAADILAFARPLNYSVL